VTTAAAPRLSVAIIARNEAERLPGCLASVRDLADEIILLDTLSTDATAEIARAAGARVERHPFEGFGPSKQRSVNLTTGDWVLSLDADERVSPALAAEIRRIVADPTAAAAYEVRWEVYFLGRRMRHGGLGSKWVLKLFRRGAGRFTDELIHEHVRIDGPVARLAAPLEHHTVRHMTEYFGKLQRLEREAAIRAHELRERGREPRWWDILRLPANFLLYAIVRLGILDGMPGLIWAAGSAYLSWRKRDLLRTQPAAGPGAAL
jgi:glycosyltransferase involved in cell wall biosynthesis